MSPSDNVPFDVGNLVPIQPVGANDPMIAKMVLEDQERANQFYKSIHHKTDVLSVVFEDRFYPAKVHWLRGEKAQTVICQSHLGAHCCDILEYKPELKVATVVLQWNTNDAGEVLNPLKAVPLYWVMNGTTFKMLRMCFADSKMYLQKDVRVYGEDPKRGKIFISTIDGSYRNAGLPNLNEVYAKCQSLVEKCGSKLGRWFDSPAALDSFLLEYKGHKSVAPVPQSSVPLPTQPVAFQQPVRMDALMNMMGTAGIVAQMQQPLVAQPQVAQQPTPTIPQPQPQPPVTTATDLATVFKNLI